MIFPITETLSHDIEDVRFVQFEQAAYSSFATIKIADLMKTLEV
ncbi:hypothetical protein [Reyranella sp.]